MDRSTGGGRTGQLVAALAVVAMVAGAACSSGSDPDVTLITDPIETTSSTEPSVNALETTTTAVDPDADLKAEIAAAYEARWDAYLQIFADPDPANPLIAQIYTGEALDWVLDGITENLLAGQALRLPDDPANWSVRVLGVEIDDASSATVTACIVEGTVLYDVNSGAVLNDTVATDIETASMRLEDGRWKVALAVYETLEHNPGCDD